MKESKESDGICQEIALARFIEPQQNKQAFERDIDLDKYLLMNSKIHSEDPLSTTNAHDKSDAQAQIVQNKRDQDEIHQCSAERRRSTQVVPESGSSLNTSGMQLQLQHNPLFQQRIRSNKPKLRIDSKIVSFELNKSPDII